MIKRMAKKIFKKIPIIKSYCYGRSIYRKMLRGQTVNSNSIQFFINHHAQYFEVSPLGSKSSQVCKLIRKLDIKPIENGSFFYTIDCFKTIRPKEHILENCTIDYNMVVNHSLAELRKQLAQNDDDFSQGELCVVDSLQGYFECAERSFGNDSRKKQLAAIKSLFERPANSFFEALQRILFYNQFLWQTGHLLNGLGHLDWILENLYLHDLESGVITREIAFEFLKDFFYALHSYYWFKSAGLMGDTGQIVILGGRDHDGKYHCNDLTYLFIEVSKELKLPDPKVLLRCTADMPEDLLELAMDCISTGIGAPLLSNDDVVIPAMISCGYDETDAYNYGTAACWEPLVSGLSCDANNIASLNFAIPLVKLFESEDFDKADSVEKIVELYTDELKKHIGDVLTPLTTLEFEEDPLLSLLSPSSLERKKDITRGGAKYNNLGLTSVGLGCVVNSILNIKKLAFDENRYSLFELNKKRHNNFAGDDALVTELKELSPAYGSDDDNVIKLTKYLMSVTSTEFSKYSTKYGGKFKVGLSSPNYISNAGKIPATLDGRKQGEPFSVHISSSKAIPTTELLSFAMKLDYNDNRLNGNVVDFFTTPSFIKQNMHKFASLLRSSFSGGIFQMQMNVVDSKTLIAAKADPKLFPELVVRVWGFSAYFNDLPEEYKDVLIARAIESEKAA